MAESGCAVPACGGNRPACDGNRCSARKATAVPRTRGGADEQRPPCSMYQRVKRAEPRAMARIAAAAANSAASAASTLRRWLASRCFQSVCPGESLAARGVELLRNHSGSVSESDRPAKPLAGAVRQASCGARRWDRGRVATETTIPAGSEGFAGAAGRGCGARRPWPRRTGPAARPATPRTGRPAVRHGERHVP